MLSENVFLQLMTGIKRFSREIIPCAPCSCGSDEENTASATKLKGGGPAFVCLSPHFEELNRPKEGAPV